MASIPLENLTELTTPMGEDLLYLVDDPSGSPTGKKVTLTNLLSSFAIATISRIVFTATGSYVYTHGRGGEPSVHVIDSTGRVVQVCVRHFDTNTVVISFVGTLTNATLLIV